MTNYIAVIHKDADSDFGVSFPDFPGCITAGSTVDEAKDMATEALQFHIDGMIEDEEKIPTPSSLESIMKNPDYQDCVFFLVEVNTAPPRSVKFNATMDERLLAELDKVLKKIGVTRSAFFASEARNFIETIERNEKLLKQGRKYVSPVKGEHIVLKTITVDKDGRRGVTIL